MNSLFPVAPILSDKLGRAGMNAQDKPTDFYPFSPEFLAIRQKFQTIQFMQLRALHLQRMQQQTLNIKETDIKKDAASKLEMYVKEERGPKTESFSSTECSPKNPVLETLRNPVTSEEVGGPYIQLSLRDQINFNAYLLRELEKMVRFVISNMGNMTQHDIENARTKITYNPTLLQIYDKLVIKYYSAKKCKEDSIRYILRRAFKVMKTTISKQEKVSGKQATLLLCKRCFPDNFVRIEEAKIDIKDGDELLQFMMPYKKVSKNRGMNNSFVSEIFSSDSFSAGYEKFLECFPEILQEDNEKKIDKLVSFLAECVKKDCISKFGSFSRLPWLKTWMDEARTLAVSLLPNLRPSYINKKEED